MIAKSALPRFAARLPIPAGEKLAVISISASRVCLTKFGNRCIAALILLGVVSTTTQAQVSCGKPPVEIFVDGFRDLPYPPPPPAPPAITLPPDATPLAVQISSPVDGFETRRSEVEVRGSFAGPPNTGLRINGKVPFVHGNQFVLPVLKIPTGASVIEAKVVSMTGATQSASVDISVDAGAPLELLTFNADRAGGFAPLPIRYSWSTSTPTTFARMQVDFDDNGVFELDTTTLSTPLSNVYSEPGAYTARIRLTTPAPGSVVHEATRSIVSVNSNYTRATLCYLFERMRSKLAASDVSGALESLHPSLRPRFSTFWTSNLAQLPTMAAQLGEVADGTLGRDSAQLMVTRVVAGQPEPDAFFVNFEQDVDGVWFITGM